MLGFCKHCRNTTQIQIRVVDPKAKKPEGDPVCTSCGELAEINSFVKAEMIRKRDFLIQAKARNMSVRCHACDMNVESKLDSHHNPRCMRCGAKLSLSPMMVRTMKNELKVYMSAEEKEKFKLK